MDDIRTTSEDLSERERKRELRAVARARRKAQCDQEAVSREILGRVLSLPEYRDAKAVMAYIAFGSEVRTAALVERAWADGKLLAVPLCRENELEVFRLDRFDELQPGMLGILEPSVELRATADRTVDPAELDLVIVPGLAFDRRGGRVGQGKGYYDRFLPRLRPDARRIGIAFDCQLFDEVPMAAHDVFLDAIVTEAAVYRA